MLEAHALSMHFDGRTALDGVSLRVEPGELYCLLGANGAGKTTLINLFLDFLTPSAGEARVDGLCVAEHPQASKAALAYIPEQVSLYGALSGVENLDYFARLGGRRLARDELRRLLHEAGLPAGAEERRVGTYSKGMRQKVGIAAALAKQARALLLDEPTSGLDPQAAGEFLDLLAAARARGVAILCTTHDLFSAQRMATRLGIMKQGRLVAELDAALGATDLAALYLDHMRRSS